MNPPPQPKEQPKRQNTTDIPLEQNQSLSILKQSSPVRKTEEKQAESDEEETILTLGREDREFLMPHSNKRSS